jgi:ATP/maltotriose-dependent transcriptional regulator MalT
VAAFGEALADVRAGAQRVIEIVGEPGVGKTTLLAELRAAAEEQGLAVLTGQATEFERLPFAVFVDAMDDHLSAELLTGLGDRWLSLLAEVFPALSASAADQPDLPSAERHLLYRAVRVLLAANYSKGLVLLLDDLHWVDAASAELLDHLLRHPPDMPLLLVFAHRPRQLPDRLAASFAAASEDTTWQRIEVGPLSRDEADELYDDTLPSATRRRLYELSGGNPLYLGALLRFGAAKPHQDGDIYDGDLPHTVRAALLSELTSLSPPVRQVAQAAAVLGEVFEARLVAPIAETGEAETLAGLDDLLARDLIRSTGDAQRFRFRHPLLRSVVYRATGPGWRLGAHARAACTLAERGASLPAQAIHLERSAGLGDEAAADILVGAAQRVAVLAPARAAHWLRAALRLLADRAQARPELSIQLAQTLAVAGELTESRTILRDVLSGPIPAPAQRRNAVAALAMVERLLGHTADAMRLLSGELAAVKGHPGAMAHLELGLAATAIRGNDIASAIGWAGRAWQSAATSGDQGTEASAGAVLALANVFGGDFDLAGAELDGAAAMIDRFADRLVAGRLEAVLSLGWTEIFLERFEDAVRHLVRATKLARESGQSYVLADLLVTLSYAHLCRGELAEAREHAEDAFEAALLVGSADIRERAQSTRLAFLAWSGDSRDCLAMAEKVAAETGNTLGHGLSVSINLLAQTRLLNNDGAGARQAMLTAGGGETLPLLQFPVRTEWFQLLAHAELMVGDLDAAAAAVERAQDMADQTGLPGQRGHGLLARSALLLAAGDPAGAATTARDAASAYAKAGMRLFQAQAHMAGGEALSEDRLAAMAEFGQAKTLFAECGAERMRRKADSRLRALGGRTSRPGPAGPGQGVRALSDRERQIAELVSHGHTNRQIAEQLFLSPKTVEAHLSRIFHKLDVSSRSAVASMVTADASGS